DFQCTVVRRDGLRILTLTRQRVAEVVGRIAARRFFQRLGGSGVIAGTVRGRTAPLRIAGQLLRLFRLALLQRPRRLLVRPLPPVLPGAGLRRAGQARQQDQRQQQQPATTERQRRDQQQR